ncbi:TIGR01841 family phasin [Duganella sp. FT94W]|uniref:TIGR01841 family phasin n=1 Tax=Duganella lactea TaxID=2692173 RepID=A0ABW9VBT6_9BURK|nr:TIGR01841 family phasin [Duganella lactea]MYM37093.1 TIGR01841 family phasin [Duganella lactea]
MFPQFPSPAVRTHIETLLGFYVDLSQRMFEAAQSLTELNLQLGRDLLAETGANTQRLLSSRDAGQLGANVAAQLRPGGSHALLTYQRRVAEVLSRCQASVSQSAAKHMPAVRRSANAMAEDMAHEAAAHGAHAAEQLARFQPGSQLHH